MEHLAFLLTFHLSLTLYLASFATATGEDQFVYSGFSGSNLILNGTAMVTPDGVLELTNGTLDIKGYAFYPTSWQFRRSPNGAVHSFSITFVFGMTSVDFNGCPNSMAFLILDALHSPSSDLLNRRSILAVELDTCQNNKFLEDNENDISIFIYDDKSGNFNNFQSHPAGFYDDKSGNFNNLPLVSGNIMQTWVDYDAEATQINVTLAPLKVVKPLRPLLSVVYNLSTVLKGPAYIGFSASTSLTSSKYCVLGWSFGMNRPAPTIDITKLPKLPRVVPKAHSKVLKIILPIAAAAFVLLVGTKVILLLWKRMRYAELYEDWEHEFLLEFSRAVNSFTSLRTS